MEPRWIDLEGAVNARVLAGGTLLRADNLQDLTPDDVRLLVEEHGLTDVVDLRTGVERDMEGPGPLEREGVVRVVHRSLYPESGGRTDLDAAVAPWWDMSKAVDLPDETATVRAYMGYLAHRPDSIVGALRDVARAEGAVLVHCAAGKDRTGVVCALALEAAGAPREAIVADYLATRERIDGIVARLASSSTYADEIRRHDPQSHAPQPGTMERVLELLDEREGGPVAWLGANGLEDADLEALRERLGDVAARGRR